MPVQAWVCLTAVCTALWRMLVSKEKLLEWVTAAQSEHSAQTVPWRLILPEAAAGVIAIGWQTIRLGSCLGLLWLFSPLLIAWLDRPVSQRPTVRARDQGFLLHEAEHIWRYFAEHLTAERHYLPPDNLQQFPTYEVADRTSPTNIGMALLSCLAAWELGLAEEEQVAPLLGHMLDSIQKLPKWRGHLYNWYHIKTAQPLAPIFVSTVDSGNLCACLIALSQGLREKGYPELAEQAQALANAMDFHPLYDCGQRLFYIGYDCEQQAFTPGRYDLMASEARLASYVAVARGDVPVEHWASLNRSLVGRRQYCGMVSWTGTMFEYFMPQLLLPAPVGSLLYETLCFAVCAQMDWGAARGIPWGVSESAYAVLDGGDHYRYKAHGIPALAMKREVQTDRVIAPYAAWLALSLVPRAVVRDLKQLRNLGAAGRYGLFEAVGLHPRALPNPQTGDAGAELDGSSPGDEPYRHLQRPYRPNPHSVFHGGTGHGGVSGAVGGKNSSGSASLNKDVEQTGKVEDDDKQAMGRNRHRHLYRSASLPSALQRTLFRPGHQRRRGLVPVGKYPLDPRAGRGGGAAAAEGYLVPHLPRRRQ